MFPFPIELNEFVIWLGSAGAAGVIVSLLLERLPAFQALSATHKHMAVLAVFVFLPFVAQVAQWSLGLPLVWPSEPQAWARWALALALQGLVAWGASQYAHGADPQALKRS